MQKYRFKMRALALALAVAAGLVVALPVSHAATTSTKFAFSGEAWGTSVKVGSVVVSGRTYPASLSACTAKPGTFSHNSGLALNVPGVLNTGTIDNTVAASQGSNSGSTTSTSIVQNVKLASPLITASAVKAVSKVVYTVGSGFSFVNGSSVLSLTVAGQTISAPAPNTRIDLAGLGYVILNEQSRTVTSSFARQTVNMIHLFVTVSSNVFGLSKGTQVIIAHAVAQTSTPLGAGGPVNGSAYGSKANVGTTVIAGATAPVSVGCLGGHATNTVLSTNIPGVSSTGTVYTTADAALSATQSTGETTATIQKVKLLGGVLTADTVKADAKGVFNGATHTFSDGSQFVNLVVNGKKLSSVQANTTIAIANLGTLYLHRVIKTTKSIEIRMVELVVTHVPNAFNLALGTDVRIAVANVGFRD